MTGEKYDIETLETLTSEIDRLGIELPVVQNPSLLLDKLSWEGPVCANRLCAQPMACEDAERDGLPSAGTVRRYRRYAGGGFGLLWVEATAILPDVRSSSGQLCLDEPRVGAFASLVDSIRAEARTRDNGEPVLILQLTHPGRYAPDGVRAHQLPGEHGISLVPDALLERIRDAYIVSARFADEAGFDGVDIAASHGNLLCELLAAHTRPGPFGGALENRVRLLREIVQGIRQQVPRLKLAVRLHAYHARGHPYGFGVDHRDYRQCDPTEPAAVVKMLQGDGVNFLSAVAEYPNLFDTGSGRALNPLSEATQPHEHPLTALARLRDISRVLKESAPKMIMVMGGFSRLRHLFAGVASGVLQSGAADVIGLGRLAYLYPRIPADLMRRNAVSPGIASLLDFAALDLFEEGGAFGFRMRGWGLKGVPYGEERLASIDALHDLAWVSDNGGEPCFAKPFRLGRLSEAYECLRRANPLPEMTAHIRSLPRNGNDDGEAVDDLGDGDAFRNLQYIIGWCGRDQGLAGVRIPDEFTGRNIAVIGGGPTGIAGTVRLLEKGHQVVLVERENQLGGMPTLVYPAYRVPDAGPEIAALLDPAVCSGRLKIDYGKELGRNLSVEFLMSHYDVVLIAAGLWYQPGLGKISGVWNSLMFLKAVRRGDQDKVSGRVVVLAGGDGAMDAAVTAHRLGAQELIVIHDGSRMDMHWHLPDEWFETKGVHLLLHASALGYDSDVNGSLRGLRILQMNDGLAEEKVIPADMVIEAMGLAPEAGVVVRSRDRLFWAGALVNGGGVWANVFEMV